MINKIKNLKAFFSFLRPYLSPKRNPQLYWQLSLIVICLSLNLMTVYMAIQTTASFTLAINTLMVEGKTFLDFIKLMGIAVRWLSAWSLASSAMIIIKNYLANTLNALITNSLIEKWFNFNNFYFLRFVEQANNENRQENPTGKHNPAHTLTVDIQELSIYTIRLFFSFFETLFSFMGSSYYIAQLSGSLKINLFNKTIDIPGYVVLASIGYAFLKNKIIGFIKEGLNKGLHINKFIFGALYHRIEKINAVLNNFKNLSLKSES
jgi:ABC-type uncharacterized transport system fused permease/ATPase subunit